MVKINDRRNVAMGRGRNHRPASNIKELVRHHTGVNVDQSMAILEGYWKNTHGWDIGGYHEVIHPDGTVDLNYDPTTMTYGVGNHNPYTMHISLIGNGKFTDAQEKAFEDRALYHMKNLNISVEKVKGHNEYSGHEKNACPGIDMSGVRARLKALLNKPVANPSISGQSGIVKKYAETGVFYPDRTLHVYDKPSIDGKVIATYYSHEYVKYHTVHIGNGHVWIEYTRGNGGKGYIAIRTYKNGQYGGTWGVIQDNVVKHTPVSVIERSYAENGTFYPNTTIPVYDQPFEFGKKVATYYKGESVTYKRIHLGNGYVWLEYTRSNGSKGYIPCREYSNGKYEVLWGTIK